MTMGTTENTEEKEEEVKPQRTQRNTEGEWVMVGERSREDGHKKAQKTQKTQK